MDVSTNSFSTGDPYRTAASRYNSGANAGADGSDTDSFTPTAARPMPFGDSLLVGSALPRKSTVKAADVDPEQTLKTARIVRAVTWGLGGISLLVFLIMFIQPLLLPIFTLGTCFSGGMGEWLDFSFAVLKISLIPAAIGMVLSWVGYFAHRKVKELTEQQDSSTEQGRPLMNLSPALMARLSSGGDHSQHRFPV
ncbi:MAG: hypothetical protein Q8K75_07040 [Chlamydiales bacterium]|nr:hypothetical protein [Chlamydiales bacterium]